MKWNLISTSNISEISQLKKMAHEFSKRLKNQEVILLNGPMAVGKSEFVKQMASIILNTDSVSSPSYALHHEYSHNDIKIDHWDLYRLQDEDELESVGFWDSIQNKNLIFIEWSEKLNQEWLPKDKVFYRLDFEFNGRLREVKIYQAA